MLCPTQNPLLTPAEAKVTDLSDLRAPVVLDRSRRGDRRLMLDLRRKQSAREAVAALTHENELFGFTKGQFSLLDLLTACLEKTGPAHLTISTWTAARKEIEEIAKMMGDSRLLGMRWLVDYTFVRRDKAATHHIRETFGTDAVRVANTHSKFALFRNDAWQLVLRSSMNLNMNPRFEDFTLAHDPELMTFMQTIVDEIWTKQKRTLADEAKPGEHLQYFLDQM